MRRGSASSTPPDATAVAASVAEVVMGVEGVVALGPGRFAEAATYGPSRKVAGVVARVEDGAVALRLHIVARDASRTRLPRLARTIQTVVTRSVLEQFGVAAVVHVVFEDLSTGDGENE